MSNIQHKRGTRSALNSLAGASGLLTGQIYIITDEPGRIAVATANNAYTDFMAVSTQGKLLGRGGASGAGKAEEISVGRGLSLAGTILAAAPSVYTDTAFSGAIDWNSDGLNMVILTAQNANLTFNADTGSPTQGMDFTFRITASGATRTITFKGGSSKAFADAKAMLTPSGSDFQLAIPSGVTMYLGLRYNATTSRWDVVALV